MGFQSTVSQFSGLGVPGDFYTDGPRLAESYVLNSTDADNNVFGRAFTKTSGQQGVAEAGGTGVFAGILVNPKGSTTSGPPSGALDPTLTLPNNSQGELCTMGNIVVSLPAAANIGDVVLYDTTTGELSTIAPGVDYPTGTFPVGAEVDYFNISGAGLAVIRVIYTTPTPAPAP